MKTHRTTDGNGQTRVYRDNNDNTKQVMNGDKPAPKMKVDRNNPQGLNDNGDCLSRLLPFIVVGIIFTTEIVNLVIS